MVDDEIGCNSIEQWFKKRADKMNLGDKQKQVTANLTMYAQWSISNRAPCLIYEQQLDSRVLSNISLDTISQSRLSQNTVCTKPTCAETNGNSIFDARPCRYGLRWKAAFHVFVVTKPW